MQLENVKIMDFSPVGTTRKITQMMAEHLGVSSATFIDLTVPENRERGISFQATDVVVMAFPVYAGRVSRVPRYFMKQVHGNGAKCIAIVTYGNRAYDDALREMTDLVKKSGFNLIAAGAFVCEHAFKIGLGTDRPDADDERVVKTFAEAVKHKINNSQNIAAEIQVPGDFPYKTQFRKDFGGPLVPTVNDGCTNCGQCSERCPVTAIDKDHMRRSDVQKCITCYRCIVECPQHARMIELDDFKKHSKWLEEHFKERKEPAYYV